MQDDIISYAEVCKQVGKGIQRGMNFRANARFSVLLMSTRIGAPYDDRFNSEDNVLVYEGHDVPNTKSVKNPKKVDQPLWTPTGKLTDNGKFVQAVEKFKVRQNSPEPVRVYDKIASGIWSDRGTFDLIDYKTEISNGRRVFKFILTPQGSKRIYKTHPKRVRSRVIPTLVKLEVYKRDKGRCAVCKSKENLHFDHILPFSKGGDSNTSENIQILCSKHNLHKSAKIE